MSRERLRESVQALAQPPEAQRALFPDFVVLGDELALDFDEALRAHRRDADPPSPHQAAALGELDDHLSALSGPAHLDFWEDPSDPRWEHVRALAARVLDAFGWPHAPPPRNGAVYVSAARVTRNA